MDRSKLPSSSMTPPPPNNICNDIIVEILSWLPVDSLLRFKSVCKSWSSLITNPIFAKLQTAKAQIHNPTIMFTSRTHYSLKSMDKLVSSSSTVLEKLEMVYPFDSTKYFFYIVGSCNGLICICMRPAAYFDHLKKDRKLVARKKKEDRNETLCLWNPSTKEFKQLPSHEEVEDDAPFKFPPYRDSNGRRRRRSLSKVASYGFGYDHVMEDYKVIASVQWFSKMDDGDEYDEMDDDNEEVMNHQYYMYHYELKVYTLGTDSWRRIQAGTPYESECCIFRPWLHANGAFHRIAQLSSSDIRILSFDIVEEVYREVPKPDCFYTSAGWKLAVLRGCLCCVCFYMPFTTEVWMMMNYGVKESWTKLLMITNSELYHLLKPVWFCRNGELLMEDKINSKHVIYDPKHNEIKLLNYPSNTTKFMLETVIYIASLVSLKSQKEIEKELIIC